MYTIIKKDLTFIDCSLAGCWEYQIVTANAKESLGTYKECKNLVKQYEHDDEMEIMLNSH